jgi:S-sulfo-L-cysteine synthase (O-acetyl-L-serine-dependent)
VPKIYDPSLADVDLAVSTEDAHAMTRRLAAEEGLLVGISSGANLAGALDLLANQRRASSAPTVAVVIFPDGGERYLSESFWSENA